MLPPYMVQLCRRLFQNEDRTLLSGVCSSWLQQALDHCKEVLTKKPGCRKLWNRLLSLKRMIFPEVTTSLLSNKIPISVHPDLLSPTECQELASQIVKDYIHHIPRYTEVLSVSHKLWLLLRGLIGLLIVGACVVIIARWYNAIQVPVATQARKWIYFYDRLMKKNVRRVVYETKHLSVVPEIDPALLRCGCPTLGLKIDAKRLSTIKAILVKIRDDPANADNAQSMRKFEKFFQNPGKYRLVVDLDFEAKEVNSRVTKPSAIPTPRHSRRMGIQRRPK